MIRRAEAADLPALASLMAASPLLQRYRATPDSALDSLTEALHAGHTLLVSGHPLDPVAWLTFAPRMLNGQTHLRLLALDSHRSGPRLARVQASLELNPCNSRASCISWSPRTTPVPAPSTRGMLTATPATCPAWSGPTSTKPSITSACMDDLSLLSIVADTSFTYDTRGRMLLTNEPLPSARRPAPRLWIGHTGAGSVVRFGCGLPDSLAEPLTVILGDEPVAPDLTRPPRALPAIRSALVPIARETAGPEYRFPGQLPAAPGAIAVMVENRELARDTFPWLLDEVAHWQPCFAIVRDGQAVSVCFSSRIGPGACAAGVETLPEF